MRSSNYRRWTVDARLLYETANRMIESSVDSPNDNEEYRRGIVTLLEQLVANGQVEYDGYQFLPTPEKTDRWVRRYEIPIPHKNAPRQEAKVVEEEMSEPEISQPQAPKKRRGRPPGSKNKPKQPVA